VNDKRGDPGPGPTARTRLRRLAARGAYDLETVKAVLDAQQVCHVAYVENGEPRVIPTLYLRRGDEVYLHGNRQSALLRHLAGGGLVALSTLTVDGVVVARSGFHCSMNYRSVVVFGHGEEVPAAAKAELLDAFVAALIPGHEAAVRAPTPQEVNATTVVRISLDEASTKIRTGPPVDAPEDLEADVWAGLIPLGTRAGEPVAAPDLKPGMAPPAYVRDYQPRS